VPRPLVLATVALVAIAAAGAVVGITLATRDRPAALHPQPGKPPIGKTLDTPAAAAIRRAFADWPHGSIPAMLKLQLQYPKDPVVQFYVGLAYAWAGYNAAAVPALRAAEKYGRNTPIEVSAEALMNPEDAPINPTFQLSSNADSLLHKGAALEAAGHLHSAESVFARNARLHPNDPEALAAAAFGLFDKDKPSLAFGKLGPLAKRFPQSQSVHFNLGYLLVVIGRSKAAVAQFKQTKALGSTTNLGVDASRFLTAIANAGTADAAK
jgi:tetratricopeptide (TPR) repeat protein